MSLFFSSYRLFAVFDKLLKYSLIVLPLFSQNKQRFLPLNVTKINNGCVMFFCPTFVEHGRVWKPWPRRARRRGRAEICRARNIFFPSRSTKRYNSNFFSLYQLQIVLLTIANKKKYWFSRNYDFISNLTCARGMKDPAAPCRATCIR